MGDFPDRIFDHFEGPYHFGPHPAPTHRHAGTNLPCGDVVGLELAIAPDGSVSVWHTAKGCIVSQAAASILTEWADGRSAGGLRGMTAAEMLRLFDMPSLTPARQKCALLAWQVLIEALREGAA